MDINSVKKKKRLLELALNPQIDRAMDWTVYKDRTGFIKSLLSVTTYGEVIEDYDDEQLKDFCIKHNLVNDDDLVKFALANVQWDIEDLIG